MWWHLQCIIGRLIDQLQRRLRLVVRRQRFLRQLRCFWWRYRILRWWRRRLRRWIGKYRFQHHMGRWIRVQYRWQRCILKPRMANHRHNLHFRIVVSNQLIVIQRMIISCCWWWSSILLRFQWLRMTSMNRIVLDSWLGWRHLWLSNPMRLGFRCRCLRLSLRCFQLRWWLIIPLACSNILLRHRIRRCLSRHIHWDQQLRFGLGRRSRFGQSCSYLGRWRICELLLQRWRIICHRWLSSEPRGQQHQLIVLNFWLIGLKRKQWGYRLKQL